MSISSEQVTHIAKLARLKTNPEKSEYFATHLSRIMDLVEKMNQIDTSGVEPMSHPQEAALRLREDVVTAENLRDQYRKSPLLLKPGFIWCPR